MRPVLALLLCAPAALAQGPAQPRVQPGPSEPDWPVLLDRLYGLRMWDDLLNPVRSRPEATPGLFRKVGPGPVAMRPVLALGLDVRIEGGWYVPRDAGEPQAHSLWSYRFKSTARDVEEGRDLTPPLLPGSRVEFDPGDGVAFGLWVGNAQFRDRVFSQPGLVARLNPRLAKQPYKAMIYPAKGPDGRVVPHSYLIGWEYSTNDDFQDVVCRIDHVELLRGE